MNSYALRLRHHPTGQCLVVSDGQVYADVNGDGRIDIGERLPGPHNGTSPEAVIAAVESLTKFYELAYSAGTPAPGNGDFISDGLLNAAEMREFKANGVRSARNILERHLAFFDLDTGDGIIGIRENWRAWRRLGYGRLRAFVGVAGSALVFGRLRSGFSIDISRIGSKRRKRVTGIYSPTGEINQPLLDECLAKFKGHKNARRQDGAIPQHDALAIVADAASKNGGLGAVSTRQFKSLFDLCTRLNQGQKVITADQFRRLFDGSLLYAAASLPASNGRLRLPATIAPLAQPYLLALATIGLAAACIPRPGDRHSWLQLASSAAFVLTSWLISQFVPGRTAVERLVILSIGILLAASTLGGLSAGEWLAVWPIIVAAAAIALNQQWYPVVQYIFFCRFPLLLALTTMLLPLIALVSAPELFKSMLALGFFEIAFVVLLTMLAAEVFVSAGSLIANHAGARYVTLQRWDTPGQLIDRWAHRLAAVITFPLAAALVREAEGSTVAATLAALLGGVGAVGLVRLLETSGKRETVRHVTDTTRKTLGGLLTNETLRPGYVESDSMLAVAHLHYLVFFLLTIGFYIAGYFLLAPDGILEAPAIAFVIFILMMLGWLLPGVSFFADKYRVPTVVAIAAVPLVLYFINDIDHYFDISPRASQVVSDGSSDLRQAFSARLERSMRLYSQEEPVVIAIAAGGGGGSAAYWTTRVLAGLQQDNSARFTDSIHMVSSVSGGSVGTLYLIDALLATQPPGAPTDEQWQSTLATARTSTLEAVAWGLAYPDLWRFFSISPWNRSLDRGWAFEEALDRQLSRRGALLSQWRGDIVAGRMPGVLLNATVSEAGERLVLSPLRLHDSPGGCAPEPVEIPQPGNCDDRIDARTVESIYGRGADLRAVTATRLSATFPWVTPISKARGRGAPDERVHLADGGYYDNDGVVTLVEWTRKAIEFSKVSGVRKILIVDVRLASTAPDIAKRSGWVYEVFGPIITMMNVRGPSQTSRNATDVELLIDLKAASGLQIKYVAFPLTTRTSRSWRLSRKDVASIDAAWSSDPDVCEARRVTGEFLSTADKRPCDSPESTQRFDR
jgi:hypothetical protein